MLTKSLRIFLSSCHLSPKCRGYLRTMPGAVWKRHQPGQSGNAPGSVQEQPGLKTKSMLVCLGSTWFTAPVQSEVSTRRRKRWLCGVSGHTETDRGTFILVHHLCALCVLLCAVLCCVCVWNQLSNLPSCNYNPASFLHMQHRSTTMHMHLCRVYVHTAPNHTANFLFAATGRGGDAWQRPTTR